MARAVKKTCRLTRKTFEIPDHDVEMYRAFGLPLPEICIEERFRRLLAFRNERKFFSRPCSVTGKKIFSTCSSNIPFPVVSLGYWWSGEWDGTEFGRDFDFNGSFFTQLFELWRQVPRPACSVFDIKDSRAVQNAFDVRDSFLVFDSYHVLSSFYSLSISNSEHCVDCLFTRDSRYCYECVDCFGCEKLRWSDHCINCVDSWFLKNCIDCRNCLFSSNLQGKEYYVFNRQVSPEEYQSILEQWTLTSRQRVDEAKTRFSEFLESMPVPHIYANPLDSNSGNYLYDCNDCHSSYQCFEGTNLINCAGLFSASNCIDGYGFGDGLTNAAQFVSVGKGAKNIVNCVECWNNVSDLTYSAFCENSSNLFGCIGLRGREYCIFNKQYSPQSYKTLKDTIIAYAKEEGIWGAFFPPIFSGYAYNHSSANVRMPLSKVQADLMEFVWDDDEDKHKPSALLQSAELSDRMVDTPLFLDDLDDSLLSNNVYLCEMTGRPFQYTKEEVAFYREMQVAPPARSFEQRQIERINKLSTKPVVNRPCDKTGEPLQSAFPPSWNQPVYEYPHWAAELESNSD